MSQDLAYRQLAVMILWRAVKDAQSNNGHAQEARVWLAGPGADLAGPFLFLALAHGRWAAGAVAGARQRERAGGGPLGASWGWANPAVGNASQEHGLR